MPARRVGKRENTQKRIAGPGQLRHNTRHRPEPIFDVLQTQEWPSHGQVLRGVSDQEIEKFTEDGHAALQDRVQDLERSAQQLLRTLESTAAASLDGFRAQMASSQRLNEYYRQVVAELRASLEKIEAEEG